MSKKEKISIVADYIGLSIIGILSAGYFVYGVLFAEKHIQLSFLNFPIFVGEIGIALCLVCVLVKYILKPWPFSKWWWMVIAYFCFVVCKALYGYSHWGPLAFRNAALLYYPVCAVFGFIFFQRRYFTNIVKICLSVALICILYFRIYYDYWVFSGILLAVMLSSSIRQRWLKWILLVLILFISPYNNMFRASRMAILGNSMASLFLIFGLVYIWNIPKRFKCVIVVFGLILISFAVHRYSDHNEVSSLVNIKKMKAVYGHFESKYKNNMENHVPYEFGDVQLFSPNKQSGKKYIENRKEIAKRGSKPARNPKKKASDQSIATVAGYKNDKSLLPYNNAVYRLLVWRDVVEDYWQYKPLFGMDFGKPIRSKRLEIGGWGGQWRIDGWVPVHNSLLHIVYRTGIVGVCFIVSVILLFIHMLREFLRMRSFNGVAMSSIFIFWGVCANFLLTLEFPYSAIPMWSLYGMMLAYYLELKNKNEDNINELQG